MTPKDLDLERLMLIPSDGKAVPAHPAFRVAIRKALREGWKWRATPGGEGEAAPQVYVVVEEHESRRLGLRFSRFGVDNALWLPTAAPVRKGGRFLRVLASEDLPEHSSLRPGLGEMVFDDDWRNSLRATERTLRVRWRCLEHEDCAGNVDLGMACEAAKPVPSRHRARGAR